MVNAIDVEKKGHKKQDCPKKEEDNRSKNLRTRIKRTRARRLSLLPQSRKMQKRISLYLPAHQISLGFPRPRES
jgi:hypothetical protein